MAQFIGENIKIVDKEDRILIVVRKDKKMRESENGRTQILAATESNKFQALENISGKKFEGKDIGLMMRISVRDARAESKPKKKTA